MSTEIQKLKGEGDTERIKRVRVRKCCEVCGEPAHFKHTFLLAGYRHNQASSAYGKDDCSWCEDSAAFTCETCRPETPGGYVEASRFECCDRFAHLFLEWENVEFERGTT